MLPREANQDSHQTGEGQEATYPVEPPCCWEHKGEFAHVCPFAATQPAPLPVRVIRLAPLAPSTAPAVLAECAVDVFNNEVVQTSFPAVRQGQLRKGKRGRALKRCLGSFGDSK